MSLAPLGNLVAFHDANHISIEDDTDISFSEDVAAHCTAYGWHVQTVDWTSTGRYVEDVDAVLVAIEVAKADTGRPSLIVLRTVIGWPAPTLRNTGAAHGSALGDEKVAAVKTMLGFDPHQSLVVEDEVLAHTREAAERGRAARERWDAGYSHWRADNADRAALLDRLRDQRFPEGRTDTLPVFPADARGMATRKARGRSCRHWRR